MKANELRIGNLISWISSGDIEKVMKIDVKHVNEVRELDLKPIPLTEEWLVKFGFKNGNIMLNTADRYLCFSAKVESKFYFYLSDAFGDNWCLNYIQYVNQLQNLYFSLTGEELELKHD